MSQTNRYIQKLMSHGKVVTMQMLKGEELLLLSVSTTEHDDHDEVLFRPEHIMLSKSNIEDSLEELANYEDMRYKEGFQA